jgi:hypothetical protein
MFFLGSIGLLMMGSDLEYFLKACEWNENVVSGGVVGVEPGIGFCIIIWGVGFWGEELGLRVLVFWGGNILGFTMETGRGFGFLGRRC